MLQTSRETRDRVRRAPGGAAIAAVLGVLAGCHSAPPPAAPPPAVTVAPPVRQSVTNYLEFTGNTAATESVMLVARVEGYLDVIHFTDGAQVKKGDLLFTIQQDQYKAQLQQAQAQVAAQKAALEHATTELGRYTALVKKDSAPQTQVDRWQFEKDSAAAALLAAQAQVELAQLNLGYTKVTAPFDGRIGRHLVDVGNVVGGVGQPGNLAQIDRTDPLYVYFTIDERDLLRIAAQRRAAQAAPVEQQQIAAAFGLLDEKGYPYTGKLDFASLDVAPTTGTLQVRGIFANPQSQILPGLFVRVRIASGSAEESLLIPGDAIGFDQQGEYVLLVNSDDVVERRPIKTGTQVGQQYVVTEGLAATDRIVVDGLARAIPGRKVAPDQGPPAVAPAAAPATPAAHS